MSNLTKKDVKTIVTEVVVKATDDLARIVAKGFEGVDKRFDGMKADVDKRFDALVNEMTDRFEKADKRFTVIEARLDTIELELIDIKKKLDNVVYRHEFELLKDRISKLEERVGLKK